MSSNIVPPPAADSDEFDVFRIQSGEVLIIGELAVKGSVSGAVTAGKASCFFPAYCALVNGQNLPCGERCKQMNRIYYKTLNLQ